MIKDYELCNTVWKKARGLMFRRKHEKPLLFIFNRKARLANSIHSFFVFFPFDAVWLDENMKVVDIKQNIKPFTPNLSPKKPAKYLLEFPAGKSKNLRIGEKVSINGIKPG